MVGGRVPSPHLIHRHSVNAIAGGLVVHRSTTL